MIRTTLNELLLLHFFPNPETIAIGVHWSKKRDKEPLTDPIPSQEKNMMKVGERREEANANDEYEKEAGKRVSLLPYFIVCVVFLFLSQTTSKVESLSLSLSPPPLLVRCSRRRELEMKERRRNKVLRCIEKERTPAGKGEARRSEARQ